MTAPRNTVILVICVVLLAVSGTYVVSATGTPSPNTSTAPIEGNLETETGTVDVMIHVEGDISNHADNESIAAKQRTAKRLQAPVVGQLSTLDGVTVTDRFWLTNTIVATVDTTTTPIEAVATHEDIKTVSSVARIERPAPPSPEPTVSTTSHSSSDNLSRNVTWGLDQIDAPEAWQQFGTRGNGTKIAVLDTGVDPDHPDIDIRQENWAVFNGTYDVTGTAAPKPSYIDEHGTHVSGTVTGGNASGTTIGVAPDATLMHANIFDSGSGSISDMIKGMQWAAENDADVISLSLGTSQAPLSARNELATITETLIEDHDVVIVASSGNARDDADDILTPADIEHVIAVGATGERREVPSWSMGTTFDPSDRFNDSLVVDWENPQITPYVVAPGDGVYSSIPGSKYKSKQGTSMASPHVSGTVGLMRSNNPSLTHSEVSTVIAEATTNANGSTDETLLTTRNNRSGYGIINAYRALKLSDPGGYYNISTVTTNTTHTTGTNLTVNATIKNENILGESATETVQLVVNGSVLANTTVEIPSETNQSVELTGALNYTDTGNQTVSVKTSDTTGDVLTTVVAGDPVFDVSFRGPLTQQAVVGTNTTINATVENVGGYPGTPEPTLRADNTTVATPTENLSILKPGHETTVSFNYTATESDLPVQNMTVTTANDSTKIQRLSVVEPAIFAVKLGGESIVEQGSTLELTTNVENVGGLNATQPVHITTTNDSIASSNVSLAPGKNTTLSTNYTTLASQYPTLNVTAQTPTRNDTHIVTITPSTVFEIEDSSMPSTVVEGDSLSVRPTIRNSGEKNGTVNVSLLINGTVADTVSNLSLNSTEAATIELTSDTPSVEGSVVVTVRTLKRTNSSIVEVQSSDDIGGGLSAPSDPAPTPEPPSEPTNATDGSVDNTTPAVGITDTKESQNDSKNETRTPVTDDDTPGFTLGAAIMVLILTVIFVQIQQE